MGNSELAALLNLSPDFQNEFITLIGDEILSSISSEIKDASCFAVIADETTDKLIKSIEHSCKIFKRRYFDTTIYWYDKSVKFER